MFHAVFVYDVMRCSRVCMAIDNARALTTRATVCPVCAGYVYARAVRALVVVVLVGEVCESFFIFRAAIWCEREHGL